MTTFKKISSFFIIFIGIFSLGYGMNSVISNSASAKVITNKRRANKYKLIWTKRIKKSKVTISNAKWLYSKRLYQRYSSDDVIWAGQGNTHYAVAKEKLYNKFNHRYYIFYKVLGDANSSRSAYWINQKWTIFLTQKYNQNPNKQIVDYFKGYRSSNEMQNIANLYVSYMDNEIQTDGFDDGPEEEFDDDILDNSKNDIGLKYMELNHNKNKYSKMLFNELNHRKISFKTYFRKLFKQQGNYLDHHDAYYFNKNGSDPRIGVYVYPKGTFGYGNIVIVLIRNDK